MMSVSGLSPDTNLLTVLPISDSFSVDIGLAAPESLSQIVDTETSISAGLSISASCQNYIPGPVSASGIAAELRPPRT